MPFFLFIFYLPNIFEAINSEKYFEGGGQSVIQSYISAHTDGKYSKQKVYT